MEDRESIVRDIDVSSFKDADESTIRFREQVKELTGQIVVSHRGVDIEGVLSVCRSFKKARDEGFKL